MNTPRQIFFILSLHFGYLLIGNAFTGRSTVLPTRYEGFHRVGQPTSTFSEQPTSLYAAASSQESPPQILKFREKETNVTVILIGAMHYNPASIALARDTIESLGEADRLGSVLVEACDIRWNKTAELYSERPFLKQLLNNEMRTACDVGLEYGRPVVLGDQRINITVARLKETFQTTLKDLVTPKTGWSRFRRDLSQAWDETLPLGGGKRQGTYLGANAFFDPPLLLSFPVSLIKYPLSYFVRDPVPTTIFFGLLAGLSYLDDPTVSASFLDSLLGTQTDVSEIASTDWLLSFGAATLETVVLGRIFLQALLAERNLVLAENIRKQCQLYSELRDGTRGDLPGWIQNAMSFLSKDNTQEDTVTLYAPGSPSIDPDDTASEKVVVAVLGMAHCNGIKQLLTAEVGESA